MMKQSAYNIKQKIKRKIKPKLLDIFKTFNSNSFDVLRQFHVFCFSNYDLCPPVDEFFSPLLKMF